MTPGPVGAPRPGGLDITWPSVISRQNSDGARVIRPVSFIREITLRFIQIRQTALAATAFFLAGFAHADTITFDDLVPSALSPTGYHLANVPQGYAGLAWQNIGVADMSAAAAPHNSGYGPGTISPTNVAFNSGGDPASFGSATNFTLEQAYFTAAWNDGLEVDVQGFLNGTLQFSKSFILNTSAPSLITFNWSNINSVSFFSHGGTLVSSIGSGTHFALDNLSISAVPESDSTLLSLAGMLTVGGSMLARRRSTPV